MIDIVDELRTGRGITEGPMRDAWVHGKMQEAADEIKRLRAEVERLRAALDMIDSISVHSGGDIHGVHPSLWEGAFKEAQIMARAALEEKQ